MAKLKSTIGGFDRTGVALDSSSFALADSVLSGGRNVRCDNGTVSSIPGEVSAFATTGLTPITMTYWNQPTTALYMFTDSTGATHQVTAAGAVTIRSAAATSLTTTGNINASLFNGGATYIVNDGVGSSVAGSLGAPYFASTSSNLTPLPGWIFGSTFDRVRAQVIRPFRNILLAANLRLRRASDMQIISAPSTIRVSNFAANEDLPTWDPSVNSDAIAGEFALSTNSAIVDMLPFQDSMYVYTEDSVFSVRLTGNSTVPISVQPVNSGRGMLSQNCGIEYQGKHFIVGPEDIYTMQGGGAVRSVSDGKVRDYFYNNLNYAALNRVFVVHNRREDEIWVCYPKGNDTSATEALIYNYASDVWYPPRDLPQVNAGVYGGTSDGTNFNDQNLSLHFAGQQRSIIRADTGTTFLVPGTNTYTAGPINASVERTHLELSKDNINVSKFIEDIYPRITGTGSVNIITRPTGSPGEVVDFTRTKAQDRRISRDTFDISKDFKVSPRTNGSYFNIQISSDGQNTTAWDLTDYTIDFSADDVSKGQS